MSEHTKNIFKQLLCTKQPKSYPHELKNFALTVNFYSPKSYNYIRSLNPAMLPHPRTIQKWLQVVECGPGFQVEALKVLKQKNIEMREKGRACMCSLIIDEMSIRKKIEWNGEKFLG